MYTWNYCSSRISRSHSKIQILYLLCFLWAAICGAKKINICLKTMDCFSSYFLISMITFRVACISRPLPTAYAYTIWFFTVLRPARLFTSLEWRRAAVLHMRNTPPPGSVADSFVVAMETRNTRYRDKGVQVRGRGGAKPQHFTQNWTRGRGEGEDFRLPPWPMLSAICFKYTNNNNC